MRFFIRQFSLVILVVLFAACSKEAMKAKPAPDAGFIPNPERQVKREDLPFQKVWVKPGFNKFDYREIVIAPVNTSYLLEMDWWQKTNFRNAVGSFERDVQELARYMQKTFIKAFEEAEKKRFKVVKVPSQWGKSLRLEMALVEVVPSKPVLNALGFAAGPVTKVPGVGSAASMAAPRNVAFEARIRDLQTGKIVATFADRERQVPGPIDVTRLTWFEPARDIIDEWAEQLVQVANRERGEKVKDPVPFTLRPW